jgi:hypothetical protein
MRVRCPFCEEFHKHPIDETPGVAQAHCRGSGSPFGASGYILSEGSSTENLSELVNRGLRIPKLLEAMRQAAPELQAALASALLKTAIEPGRWNGPVTFNGWEIRVCDLRWQAHKQGPLECEQGDNLISLAAFLYPADQGAAAIRAFETVTGMRLDDEHCLAAWHLFNHAAEHGEGRR